MKETKASIGYDPEACVFYVGFAPTFDLKNRQTIKTDAKVLFNLKGDEITDVRIVLPDDKLDFLKKIGKDPVACPICASLKSLKPRLRNIIKTGSVEKTPIEKKDTDTRVSPLNKDYIKKLLLLELLG